MFTRYLVFFQWHMNQILSLNGIKETNRNVLHTRQMLPTYHLFVWYRQDSFNLHFLLFQSLFLDSGKSWKKRKTDFWGRHSEVKTPLWKWSRWLWQKEPVSSLVVQLRRGWRSYTCFRWLLLVRRSQDRGLLWVWAPGNEGISHLSCN